MEAAIRTCHFIGASDTPFMSPTEPAQIGGYVRVSEKLRRRIALMVCTRLLNAFVAWFVA